MIANRATSRVGVLLMSVNNIVVQFAVMSESRHPRIDYASRDTNLRPPRYATAALVFGIAGLLVPPLELVAIVLGLRACEWARRGGLVPEGRFRVALRLGVAGLVLHLVAASVFAQIHVLEARKIHCQMNMRVIFNALVMYTNENRSHFPPDFTALIRSQSMLPGVFVCPSRRHDLPSKLFTDEIAARKAGELDYVVVHGYFAQPPMLRRYMGEYHGPVVLERLSNHGNGAHVLWTNGVQFETKASFTTLVNQIKAQALITDEEYQFLTAP